VFVPHLPQGNINLASPIPPVYSNGVPVVSSQTQAQPDQAYYTTQRLAYPSPRTLPGSHAPSDQDPMAVHAAVSRHMYPSISNYSSPQVHSPTSIHHPQHDAHGRGMYPQGFAYPQQVFFSQPQYTLPAQPAYTTHAPSQSYQPVTSVHANVLPSQQYSTSMTQGLPPSPPLKMDQAVLQRPPTSAGSNFNHVPSLSHSSPSSSGPSANGPNTSAAPGPIPATTPLVVHQDPNGVQWIAFEYSRDRVKMEYTIRCDVESVKTEELSQEFRSANCVYPRACGNKDQYKGNRLSYETECNNLGWALAELNPVLREKRGLIQRAVDSWRNSNQDPKLRSRRVRRQAKMSTRKNHLSQTPPHAIGHHGPLMMGSDLSRVRTSMSQLHHHHSGSDGTLAGVGGEDVSGRFHA
jgi:hypothetical protein